MYKAILFDLDGTLTDSGEGITKSVQYALEKVGKRQERQLRFTENDTHQWGFMRMNCILAFRKCYPD